MNERCNRKVTRVRSMSHYDSKEEEDVNKRMVTIRFAKTFFFNDTASTEIYT